ncbi:MAG: KH domain-containing protein [Clostridium sp.]|nr:MAG: KH domain-containing protein [Clostridium sp.]
MYYPKEMVSDHSKKIFLMGEIIREKILLLTKEEVPHSVAVIIDYTKVNEENPNYLDIFATIFVDRASQKKIIIGKKME